MAVRFQLRWNHLGQDGTAGLNYQPSEEGKMAMISLGYIDRALNYPMGWM